MTDGEPVRGPGPRTSRLSVFAFLWASQALVHHEFYLGWLKDGDPFGWLVLIFATGLLLRPDSISLILALAASSVVYNVG